jgi:hypothetical protein
MNSPSTTQTTVDARRYRLTTNNTQSTIFKGDIKVEPVAASHLGVSKEHIVPRELLQSEQAAFDPPKGAEFLLIMLATTCRVEAMIGDPNERFTRECEEFGRGRSARLYWARTLRSLPLLVSRAIGKVVVAAAKRFFGA